ncbi:MAG: hypothetical protein C0433_14210 [Cyclobacterium sp.]|nr:hypothetical protein [Cyclobacterium sp.]
MREEKYKFPDQTQLGYLNLEEYGVVFLQSILENPQATDQDEIPGATGRFGYDPSNPIPIHGVPNAKFYLNNLRLPDGQPITYQREGSTSHESILLPIDQYLIFGPNEEELGRIYISPYHKKCSEKAPEGLLTEDEVILKWLDDHLEEDLL